MKFAWINGLSAKFWNGRSGKLGVLRVNITAISKHSAAIKAKDGCSNQALASKGLYGSARP
jgi:hypothetical protein